MSKDKVVKNKKLWGPLKAGTKPAFFIFGEIFY